MKNVNYIIPVLVLVLLIAPMSAQENVSEEAGVTPDNGFMWGMERAAESVSLAFTFNETKKAQKSLEYANERAAEAQKMAQENKSEASEKAMKNWQKNMNSAEQIRKRLQENNQSGQAEKIRERMQNAEGTLERVRNRIMNDGNPNNDNALKGLNKALENVKGNRSSDSGEGQGAAGSEDKGQGSDSASGEKEIEPNVTEGKGKFSLMVSDAPADIGDFDSLEVSFSHARVFERNANTSDSADDEEENETEENEENLNENNESNTNENNETTNNTETEQEQNEEQEKNQVKEGNGFYTIELDGETVDLTEVVGDNAQEIASVYLDEGTYNKIELHVQDVVGTVNGSEVDVMVPSEKLQLVKPFTISEEEPLDFVFDINVVKKGPVNGYNLLPVISESGSVGKDIDKVEKINKSEERGRNNDSQNNVSE